MEKAGRMPPKEEMKMNRERTLVGRNQSRNWRRRERRKKRKTTLRSKKRRLRQL